jgi:hypothetical protein
MQIMLKDETWLIQSRIRRAQKSEAKYKGLSEVCALVAVACRLLL